MPEPLQSLKWLCLHIFCISVSPFDSNPVWCLHSSSSVFYLLHLVSLTIKICSSLFWGSNILLHTEILIEWKLHIIWLLFGLLRVCSSIFSYFIQSCKHWRCLPNSTLWTEKKHQNVLSYLPRNHVDSDKIWYTLFWINMQYNSLNIFQLNWIMSLHYLVKLSIPVL